MREFIPKVGKQRNERVKDSCPFILLCLTEIRSQQNENLSQSTPWCTNPFSPSSHTLEKRKKLRPPTQPLLIGNELSNVLLHIHSTDWDRVGTADCVATLSLGVGKSVIGEEG